jgi:tRNA (cytidine32/uridine32-2'-O)-methyltransferase
MRTMGLSRLVLVAPERFPDPDATAMAAGADGLMEAAPRVASVEEAVADCRLVLGCTARQRGVRLPERHPREAAAELLAAAAHGPVALLFGRERTGLTNDELQRCHAAVHIPANPEFSSLNLAAAVQVLSYELRGAALAQGAAPAPSAKRGELPATHAEMEGLFGHLAEALEAIDFHKGRSPKTVLRRLRRLLLRATPDPREVRILRGILSEAERMARLAGR